MAILNSIGAQQFSCEALIWNFVGKPEKPVIRGFLATNVTFFQIDLPFLVLAHLL